MFLYWFDYVLFDYEIWLIWEAYLWGLSFFNEYSSGKCSYHGFILSIFINLISLKETEESPEKLRENSNIVKLENNIQNYRQITEVHNYHFSKSETWFWFCFKSEYDTNVKLDQKQNFSRKTSEFDLKIII